MFAAAGLAAGMAAALLSGAPALAAIPQDGAVATPLLAASQPSTDPGSGSTTEVPEQTDAEKVEELLEGSETTLETAMRIAEALDESPLYVDDAAADRYTQPTLGLLEEKVAATKHPTYLVLAGQLDYERLNDLSLLIAQAHGGQGAYVVMSADGELGHAVELEDLDARLAVEQQFDQWVHDPDYRLSGLEWLNDVLDRLVDPQYEAYEPSLSDRLQNAVMFHPVRTALIAGAVLAALVAGVWLFARSRPLRTRKYRIPDSVMEAARSSDRDRMRRVLGQDALRIAEKLEALRTEGLTAEQSETVQRGLDAFGLARRIAEDASAAEDDLVGSLVLFDIAERSLESVERQRSTRMTTAPRLRGTCTVNPRHGEARKEGKVTAGGGRDLTVPMCAKCAHDQRKGQPLQWLRVDGAPYPDRDTVWARTLYGATEADLVEEAIRARAMR